MSTSRFAETELIPPPEFFGIFNDFHSDPFPGKVNLLVGAFKTEEGPTLELPLVRRLEQQMATEKKFNKDYLYFLGHEPFSALSTALLLGPDSPSLKDGRATGIQTLAGGGGLRLAAEILVRLGRYKTIYASDPCYGNYKNLFLAGGFESFCFYRYWDEKSKTLDFDGMLEDLHQAPKDSVVILQVSSHNPTGVDPTEDQWKQIADVIEKRHLFPLFDSAYQGFATGDLDRDVWPVRYFDSRGFEMMCVQTFSKSLGLYSERAGNLIFVARDASVIQPIRSHAVHIIRNSYSHPPSHGTYIVTSILSDPMLCEEWKGEIKMMHSRLVALRKGLRERLEKLGTPGSWNHITDQVGMFAYLGTSCEANLKLIKEYHIYISEEGRLNVSGLNSSNIDHVAECIHKVVMESQ